MTNFLAISDHFWKNFFWPLPLPPIKNIMFANSVIYKCHQYDDQFDGTFGKENKPMFVWDRPYISRCKIKSEMLWSDFYQITWNEYLLILERDDENKIIEQIPSNFLKCLMASWRKCKICLCRVKCPSASYLFMLFTAAILS